MEDCEKWKFQDDYYRLLAIEAEADAQFSWVKHLVWGVVVVACVTIWAWFK